MSVGPMGITGGFAATQLAQGKAAEDRSAAQTAEQSRRTEANRLAEAASGIGRTTEEAEAHDRDADGRRLWEDTSRQPPEEPASETPAEETTPAPVAKDPSGNCGRNLDLSG